MHHLISSTLVWVMDAYADKKTLFERSLSFNDDAIHVLIGVAIQLLTAAVLRRSIADWRPLLAVALLEIANEVADVVSELWPVPAEQLGESVKDFMLTLALPIVLFAVARRLPQLLVRPRVPEAADERSDPVDSAEQ